MRWSDPSDGGSHGAISVADTIVEDLANEELGVRCLA
jgi:hypothetical protein